MSFTFTFSTIRQSVANINGGFFNFPTSATCSSAITITSLSTFYNSEAVTGSGGLIYAGCAVSNSLTLSSTSEISVSSAKVDGGVSYMAGGSVSIIITDSTISSSTAANNGGILYASNSGSTTL